MNIETGKIIGPEEYTKLDPALRDFYVAIEEKTMTPKQRETKQASVHDTQSVLGKVYTSARKRRRAARKSS